MNKELTNQITADMTVLDIISLYPETENIFHSYDEQVGECICCQMLFDTLEDVAKRYNLELLPLLAKLNETV
jgi:hypothetical protein